MVEEVETSLDKQMKESLAIADCLIKEYEDSMVRVKDYESRFVDMENIVNQARDKFQTVSKGLHELRVDVSRLKGDVADLMDEVWKLKRLGR